MRVFRVRDERLPDLTANQDRNLYRKIERYTETYIGYRVELMEVGSEEIDRYRSVLERPRYKEFISLLYLDLDQEEYRSALMNSIRGKVSEADSAVVLRYVSSANAGTIQSLDEASELLFQAFLKRHSQIGSILTTGSGSLRDGAFE